MFWKKKTTPLVSIDHKVEVALITGIDLPMWQQSDARIKWARDLWMSPDGSAMLSVLKNTMPVPDVVNPVFDAGRVRGYQMALGVLQQMANHPPQAPVEVPVTYDKPEEGEM